MGEADELPVEPGRREAEVTGPRTWVIVLATLGVAALVIGGIVVWMAWQDRDDTAEPAPTSAAAATTVPEPVEEGAGSQLFRRETSAGIEVRARLLDGRGGMIFGRVNVDIAPTVPRSVPVPESITTSSVPADPNDTNGNGLPDFCDIDGDLTAWAIGDDAVVQGGAPWTVGVPDQLYPSLMWDGQQDDDSIVGVVMQVGQDVVSVRLTGPDGSVDEMEPVQGAVVLAVPIPAELEFNPFDERRGVIDATAVQVTAQRADGSSLRANDEVMSRGHPAWGGDRRCFPDEGFEGMPEPMPMATLPEPGAAQPADPAAARAEIELNFASLYGPRNDEAERRQLIDDPYALDIVRDEVERNGFGDDADGASVVIDELVFTSPTDAVFEYELTTPITNFPGQIGRARLVDGVWMITRGTICQDLSKAGGMCPP